MGPETGFEVIQSPEVIFLQLIEEFPELDAAASFAHVLKLGLGVGPFLEHFINELFALFGIGEELGVG